MKVGDIVTRHPITVYELPVRYDEAEPMEGTIIYIHPQNRFHTVEFMIGNRKIRESFSVYDLVPGDTNYDPKTCYHCDD